MSKAILISIKPEWVEKILSGEKTLEIRKTIPSKCDIPIDVYIYETKSNGGSGKIVAKFTMYDYHGFNHSLRWIEENSCVSREEMQKYAGKKRLLYVWQIHDLKIFDTPLELKDFNLKRPPQSWCYVKKR